MEMELRCSDDREWLQGMGTGYMTASWPVHVQGENVAYSVLLHHQIDYGIHDRISGWNGSL